MDFSNRISALRKSKHINLTEFAAIFGVDRTTVGKWEKGINYPTVEMLDKLADFFDISIDDLLGRDPAIEKYKRDEQNVKLLAYYSKLNDLGRKEAVKRVAELSINPMYRDMPIAAHNDRIIDNNELKLMRQDIDEL